MATEGASPICRLYSQTSRHRRPRPSQLSACLQGVGAPSRNLPDLQPGLQPTEAAGPADLAGEVPALAAAASSPFSHLFQNQKPGMLAFAHYVLECWESLENKNGEDSEKFIVKCDNWWTRLPAANR